MEIIAFLTVFVVASGIFAIGVLAPFVLGAMLAKRLIQKVNLQKAEKPSKAMRSERTVILQATPKRRSEEPAEEKSSLIKHEELFGKARDWSLYDSPAYLRSSRIVC